MSAGRTGTGVGGCARRRGDRRVGTVLVAPLVSVAAGALGLAAVAAISHLTPLGWGAGLAYLLVSNALLARGLRTTRAARFGWANATTALRSTLVALVTAIVATGVTEPISVPLLIAVAVPALALDAVDGWVARRTDSASDLGARFDMEVDAFLLLVLSIRVAQDLGWWVLAIGALRYVFVAAGWILPVERFASSTSCGMCAPGSIPARGTRGRRVSGCQVC